MHSNLAQTAGRQWSFAFYGSTIWSSLPPALRDNVITFRVSRSRREMYIGHARLCVCLLSIAAFPHYCMDPDVTWGMVGVPPSCALLGGFAIGARVSLL